MPQEVYATPIPDVPTELALPAVPEPNTPWTQDKRLHVTLATMAVVAINKKLGLNLDTTDLGFISGLAVNYILQSQAGAVARAKAAGQAAAANVKTTADAVSVFGGPAKMLALALVGALALGPTIARADEPAPGAPVIVEVTSGQLQLGPDSVKVVGKGCYMDEASCIATGKEIVDLRVRVKELEGTPASWVASVGLVVLALGAGFAAAWVLKK